MFDSLSDRLGGVFDRLRGRGALTEADVRGGDARGPDRPARGRRRAAGGPRVRRQGDRAGGRPAGAALGHAGPAGRQDRPRRAGRDARRRGRPSSSSTSRRRRSIMMVGLQGSGKTTTTAKLAKRLTREGPQEGADGLARRRPPGRAGAARRARPAGRGRDPADRRRPAAGRDRPPRAPGREAAGLSTCCCSTPPAGSTSTRR